LSPAGSKEAFCAAIDGGADAIYVGGASFNARINAKNFTEDELADSVKLAHLYGVKVYQTVNIMLYDRELDDFLRAAERSAKDGIDAFIVSDLGGASLLRKYLPEIPLHTSTQMSIHNSSGARFLKDKGFSRVVPARELSKGDIQKIVDNSGLEVEIFIHGALCVSHSGQCLFSSLVGGRSGNRGLCAQPCRLPYEGERYPLSLKDLSLATRYDQLKAAGIASLKIEGRLKSPEYVGSVCRVFAKAKAGQPVTDGDMRDLMHIFSRDGFTDGYLTGRIGPEMFGVKTKTEYADYKQAVAQVVKTFKEGYELKKRPLSFELKMREPYCRLTVECEGFTATVEGPPPEPAFKREVTAEDAQRALSKLGGTPFELIQCKARVEHDLFYPAAAFNDLRRRALELVEQHFAPVPHTTYPLPPAANGTASQSTPALEGWFWEPANAVKDPRLARYWLNGAKTRDCIPFAQDPRAGVFFPALIGDGPLEKMATRLYEAGFRHGLCRNVGQAPLLKKIGFTVHGDFSMNLANRYALTEVAPLLETATLSFELTLREIRALPKPLPCGIIIYGRLPLMQTKNCMLKNFTTCKEHRGGQIQDRTGRQFPILCDYDCQNILLNSTPLYLADRNREWQETGITFGRLLFTHESAQEIASLLDAYTKGAPHPEEYTRGLYYRGVL